MAHSALLLDHIRLHGVVHSYGVRRVFDGVDLVVGPAERLGLIGENGVGKSTLLRIIAGEEQPDEGSIARPARTALLWQEVRFAPDATLDRLLEDALGEVRALQAELETAAAQLGVVPGAEERYSGALASAEQADVWGAEARRDELLAGLGIGGIPLSRRLSEVSGGQRARFALAALLLRRPDALLLDEPTNHLDDDAAEFLRGQLLRWQGPVVFASHDRAFLDEVATSLVDIDPSRDGFTRFGRAASGENSGPYTEYLAEKTRERQRWEEQFSAEQDELKRLKLAVDVTTRRIAPGRPATDNDKFLKGFKEGRQQVAVTRRVRNASNRLDELRGNQVRKPPVVLRFAGIPRGSHALEDAGPLVQLSDARVDGRLSLPRLDITVAAQLLVTGANGAGKSTLLGVLAGRLALDHGHLARRKGLRLALLEQDVSWRNPATTPRRSYEASVGERRAESVPLVSLGLIAPRDLDRPIAALSTGQQRRLALALIIAQPPHLFLLDEPTNHLSLALATELEDALGAYPGAVVVASHDRWLRRRWDGDSLVLAPAL